MTYYYIIDDVASSNFSDLPRGPRIFMMPEDKVFPGQGRVMQYEAGDGPYETINQLKTNSEIFQNLILNNPRRVSKILEDNNIIKPDGLITYVRNGNEEFEKEIYNIIKHSRGLNVSKGVSGVHHFDPRFVRVVELLRHDEVTGIWEAYIEVYNSNTDKWIAKQQTTTFFPTQWSLTRILKECEFAYGNRKKLSETKYIGVNETGLKIVFIYDRCHNLGTVYPIFDEE